MPAKSKFRGWIAGCQRLSLFSVLPFLTVPLVGLYVCSAQIGFGSMTFGHLGDAMAFAESLTLKSISPLYPFGYPALLGLISLFGISVVHAAILLNVISNIGLVIVVGVLIRSETIWCRVLTLMALSLSSGLSTHFLHLWAEAPFTFLSIAALAYYQKLSTAELSGNPPKAMQMIVLAALCMAPVYVRYVGIFIPITVSVLFTFQAFDLRSNWRQSLKTLSAYWAFGLASICFALPLILKNLLIHDGLTGHPVGVSAAYDFKTALITMVEATGAYGLNLDYVSRAPILNKCQHFIQAGTLIWTIILFTIILQRLREPSFIRTLVVACISYILIFSYAQSITRLDLINYRFIHPIVPLMIVSVTLVCFMDHHVGEKNRLVDSFKKIILFGTIAIVVAGGLVRVSLPIEKMSDFQYSPETLTWVKNNLPKSSVVLVNRFGDQIRIVRSDIVSFMIPFIDPMNAGYTEAYGVELWNEASFKAIIKNRNVNYIVVFLGSNNTDVFWEEGWYGEEMSRLLHIAETQGTRLSDGFAIEVKDLF